MDVEKNLVNLSLNISPKINYIEHLRNVLGSQILIFLPTNFYLTLQTNVDVSL